MRPTRFDEIVFIDDFFRSSDNLVASHPTNRTFLRRTFGRPASRLGIACREICARSDGGTLDVATIMRALGLPRSPAGWARSCIADLGPLLDEGLVPRFGASTLVIGWGIPPSLMHLLDRQGTAFLDIEISPKRFASHLAFCVRTNDRQIEAVLADSRVDEETYWNEATALQGYFSRRGAAHLFDRDLRVGLFCGQTAIDLALVQRGEIARPIDVTEAVERLAGCVDLLVIKPHPYEPDLRHLRALAARISNVAWTDANIYALLCADNLRFVSGLSSGALLEASYFMKEGIPLISPDRNNPEAMPASCSDWITVGPGIASIECLAGICTNSPGPAPKASPFPPDALDRAFGSRWGLDAQDPGLPGLPALQAGRDYAFRGGSLPRGWLSFGWHAPGPGGAAVKSRLASIVIPLKADAWPKDALPVVQVNGKPYREGKSGFRLSARLDEPRKPRTIVLDFEFEERQDFRLQQLSIGPTDGSGHPSLRARASSALVFVAAALCLLGVMKHLGTDTDPTQASPDWTQIQKVVGTRVDAVRDDIHLLLDHHI